MRWRLIASLAAGIFVLTMGVFLLRKPPPPPAQMKEVVLATFENKFKCTLYYTPRESGFTKEAGFDVSPETRPGLEQQEYPHDFLMAVEKEGFGRLRTAHDGHNYIRYWSGQWGFADQPLDHNQHPLIAKQTCAACVKQTRLSPQSKVAIKIKPLAADFEKLRWIVSDVGSGLDDWQLDLYWGEDDPLGPGHRLSRPRSAPADLLEATVMVLK